MRGQIATKLHKLAEMATLAKIAAKDDEKASKFFSDKNAHYVVTPGLSELLNRSDAQKSIQAIHEAGVVALPYSPMLVEFEHKEHFREFVLLTQVGDKICSEYAFLMKNDPLAPMSPMYRVPIGETFGLVLPEKIDIQILPDGYLVSVHSPVNLELGMRNALIAASRFAMDVAFLCLNMQGVEKEVINCAPLNKKRIANNKPPIPQHTSLYIGRVWRRDGTSFAYKSGQRNSPRVHIRCAHTRMQRHGKGLSESHLVLIPQRLINYIETGEKVFPPRKILRK